MIAPDRFLSLDAMRGLAAILVVLLHAQKLLVPSGGIAVDFFFALSGFVLARAYDARLRNGFSAMQFMQARLVRLYPLYLAGLLFGIVQCVHDAANNASDALPATELVIGALFGVFFLPSPASAQLGPLNAPSWSLYMELLVNLVYAAVLVRLRTQLLRLVLLLSAALLFVAVAVHGSLDLGVTWRTFWGGTARVMFSFTLGVLMSRAHKTSIHGSPASFVAPVLLVAMMFVPGSGYMRVVVDLLQLLVAVPLLLWAGATFNLPAGLHRPAAFLGLISYPLYAIHYPFLMWTGDFAFDHKIPPLVWFPVLLAIVSLVSWILVRYWEPAVRAGLRWTFRPAAGRSRVPDGDGVPRP